MVFGLGIGLAMLLSWRYTKPIHNVVSAANRIAAGDLEQTLVTDSKDEIGELTQSFNFMVQKLREQKQMEEKTARGRTPFRHRPAFKKHSP